MFFGAVVESFAVILGWALFGAYIGYAAGRARGFEPAETALGGALLGLFSLIIYVLPSGNVRCPYCTEWVPPKALVCKHCHRDLAPVRPGTLATQVPAAAGRPLTARPDGRSFRCANPACGRLLAGPQDTCSHCGTVHA